MGQHSNEHLTTAQLSAYLDKELTRDELVLCEAHLQTCPRCRAALADLRVTSALLHGMPQVDVPRSFVLPANLAALPVTPARSESRAIQPMRSQYVIKRSLRALSTLAAVVGLLFILFGAVSSLSRGGYGMNSAVMAPSNSAGQEATPPSASGTPNSTLPSERATAQAALARATARAQRQQTPVATPTAPAPAESPGPQISPPAVLDLGQPEGRLSIGAALLVLGILGVLLTRRSRGEVGVP